MTLEQLRYIVEVASVGSITKAAQNLFISQPNLSTAIKNLEAELGYDIFIRSKNGTTLTYNGIQLLHHANNIQIQLNEIQQIDKHTRDETKRLSVLTQVTSASLLKMVNLYEDYADSPLHFHYRQLTFTPIVKAIIDMKADVGIVSYPINKAESVHKLFWENQIEEKILKKYRLNIGIIENHPLADRQDVSLQDIAEYPLVLLAGDEADFFYGDYLDTTGYFSHRQKISVGDIFSMYYMMDCLNGVSFILHAEKRVFSRYSKAIRLFPIKEIEPCFISIIYKKTSSPKEELTTFLSKFSSDQPL